MRRFSIVTFVLAVLMISACAKSSLHQGEYYAEHYPGIMDEYEEMKADQKKVMAWESDPSQKKLVGWIETWRIAHKGEKIRPVEEWHTYYLLFEPRGRVRTGYVSENGDFFRFDAQGRKTKIGEWEMIETGLRVFYGLPLGTHVGYEEIDPYGY